MAKTYVLYNPMGAGGQARTSAERLSSDNAELVDMTAISDFGRYFSSLESDAKIILCGGDGTINWIANHVDPAALPEKLYYYPGGTGNDFWHDLGLDGNAEPVALHPYLQGLPTVTVNGKSSKFLNGVGYGIDGYCCEEGDKQRESSDKPVNYTAIAIKGLLFRFKPCGGPVTVDGESHRYEKIWLAPAMNGRFYGGGMMCAPGQDRLSENKTVTVVVMHDSGKLKTLTVFPSIFQGEHVKHTEMVDVFTGHEVNVKFDSPCALQIDGETVLGVKEYSVKTC